MGLMRLPISEDMKYLPELILGSERVLAAIRYKQVNPKEGKLYC